MFACQPSLRAGLTSLLFFFFFFFFNFLFIYDSHRERESAAETQAEGEAGSKHREPDVGFDPGSPGSRPGPKAGAKPLRHPGIPMVDFLNVKQEQYFLKCSIQFRVRKRLV